MDVTASHFFAFLATRIQHPIWAFHSPAKGLNDGTDPSLRTSSRQLNGPGRSARMARAALQAVARPHALRHARPKLRPPKWTAGDAGADHRRRARLDRDHRDRTVARSTRRRAPR